MRDLHLRHRLHLDRMPQTETLLIGALLLLYAILLVSVFLHGRGSDLTGFAEGLR